MLSPRLLPHLALFLAGVAIVVSVALKGLG